MSLIETAAYYVCKAGTGENACRCAERGHRPCEAMENAARRIYGLIGAPIEDLELIRHGEARLTIPAWVRERRRQQASGRI